MRFPCFTEPSVITSRAFERLLLATVPEERSERMEGLRGGRGKSAITSSLGYPRS